MIRSMLLVPCVLFGSVARGAEPLTIDLTDAVVLAPPKAHAKAVQMLIEEVDKRSRVKWDQASAWPKEKPVIAVGTEGELRELLRGQEFNLPKDAREVQAEGFLIAIGADDGQVLVVVMGVDARGVLFGVGRLLRELRMHRDKVTIPAGFKIDSAPRTRLRGHQLGYRPKTNSYDGWTVAMWEQYIRDLVVFGCNAIELIPPRSDDDRDSPHFPLPPMRMMVEVSRLAQEYGIDVWVWYPALDLNYGDPKTVEFAIKEWGDVLKQLPRLDAIFVPGGDPGDTPPKLLFALLEKQIANVRRFHPKCQMWVSPQGFSKQRMDEFLELLRAEPQWLAGIVHGPQVRLSLPELRKATPARYPIRDYPDITHSRHCQYPVPDWDVAFALTEGREGSNPRPTQMATIFKYARPHTIGFITYSEGCHDDVNKCVWSALGWDERSDVREILREYSRYLIGPEYEEKFAEGLLGLEKNWVGAILKNEGIDETLKLFQALEKSASPMVKLNWRFQQALYRAYYDSLLRSQLVRDMERIASTKSFLRQLSRVSNFVITIAEGSLKRDQTQATLDYRTRVFELAESLFQSVRAQLSVEKYKAIAIERGANLDGIDLPLTDMDWLRPQIVAAGKHTSDSERRAKVDAVLNRTDPGPGGFYDALGDPERRPHLVIGPGFEKDPGFYHSAYTGFGFRANGPNLDHPREWWTHAETLYDTPLQVRYPEVDRNAEYRVRVVYGRERSGAKIRLLANDKHPVHDYLNKPYESLEFDVPKDATSGGSLTLTWNQQPGSGGTGRGCQVCEVFLIKKP